MGGCLHVHHFLSQASLQRQVKRAQATWEKKCWHLGKRRFTCRADAQAVVAQESKGKPAWLLLHTELVAHPCYAGRGRPGKDAPVLKEERQIVAVATINQELVKQETFRKACWIVGTNILETAKLSDEDVTTTYKDKGASNGGSFSQRSLVPGFLRLSQKARTNYGAEPHHGVVLVGLSPSRILAPGALSRDGANHS